MEDDQTLASQDHASSSPKKKKNKKEKKEKKSKERKAVDESSPMADAQTVASQDDAASSAKKEKKEKKSSTKEEKKKEKKSKKRKATDEPSPMADLPTIDEKKESKKPKTIDETLGPWPSASTKSRKKHEAGPEPEPIEVKVDASLTGGSATAVPPVVAYFPSGYNPLAARSQPPMGRLFRNPNHPSRVDFVVRSPRGGPDFVGKSYEGEASLPQLCNYALGVLDKATGTLKIVPIAGDKILRMDPHIEVQNTAHSQQSGVTSEAGSGVVTGVQQLTSAYGTKKDKDVDKKWRSLKEQRNDPSAYVDLDLGKLETSTSDNAPVIVRNVPPYDPTADTSEKAYVFDEIIPKNMRSHLLEILGHLESGEFLSKGYGSFVSKRVHKLENLQGEDKERLAWILSYITHLLTFLERNNAMSKWERKKQQDTTIKTPVVPQAVYRNLMIMFLEEGSYALSTDKKELLINYILVLTLFADDFRSDPTDISADLKLTRPMLKPYYVQLGCVPVSTGVSKPSVMTLPAPLQFPKESVRRKRR